MSTSWYWTPPSPKPCILTFPHCRFGAVSQSYLRCCLLGFSLHFVPNKTLQSHIVHLFSWQAEFFLYIIVLVVQLLSCVRLFATPWIAACQASLSFTVSQSLLKFMSIESVILSKHRILCHPLFLLPSIFPSIRVFSNESAVCIRWPNYWSFSFSISPSNEYPGLISFRIDWLDLLVVQGTCKDLLQHHSSKASILWCSTFYMVQLSHICT